MKLQIAVDLITGVQTLALAGELQGKVDIFEVGTPIILRDGLHTVTAIKSAYPNLTVLADTKIADAGALEGGDAFAAGADIATVLGIADDETILGVVRAAKAHGKQVMVDMLQVQDLEGRAAQLDNMGVDYICVHTAVDAQIHGKSPYDDLARISSVVKQAKTAIAGGVNMAAIPLLKQLAPHLVVAGNSLTSAADVAQAVMEMQAALNN